MYQIIKAIGKGANGEVFLARHKEQKTQSVIKRLTMRDISAQERLTIETELQLLKNFRHPNIVAFKDSFIDNNDSLNIVMPYCEGGDMHNLIEDAGGKKFTQKQILEWIVQIGLALYYMHDRRILHRDVKTQNIFLTNGRALLGDLGVAKVLQQTVDLTRTNIGTPYYMSPQQYRQKPYSYKSDIWAFGCIIYEMCNHKHVFEALSINALAVKVMRGSYSPVSQVYSQNLKNLVDEMLSQNSKKRPSIIQILKKPFLLKKAQGYLKELYSNKKNLDAGQIQSIKIQAKALGLTLEQQVMKPVEQTPRKSKSQSKVTSVEKVKKEKQKKERNERLQQIKKRLAQEQEDRQKAKQQLNDYKKIKSKRCESERNLNIKNVMKKKSVPSTSRVSTSNSKDYQENVSRIKPKMEEIDFKDKKQEVKGERKSEEKKGKKVQQIKSEVPQKKENVKESIEKVEMMIKKVEQKQQIRQFKIEEEYDMNYQEQSDSEDSNVIEEEEEEEAEVEVEVGAQVVQQYKNRQQKVTKLKEQVKEKTQIITSLKNELTKLDFEISSDSDIDQNVQKFNPAHTRLNDKVNDLKEKVILQLGRDKYSKFMESVVQSISGNSTLSKKSLIEKLGKENVGLIHFAQNIVKLERVLKKTPKYI